MKKFIFFLFVILLFCNCFAQNQWHVYLQHPLNNAGWGSASLDVLVNGEVVLNNLHTYNGNYSLPIYFTVQDGDQITTVVNPGSNDTGAIYKILDNVNNVVASVGSWDTVPTSITDPIDGYFIKNFYFESFHWWFFNEEDWTIYLHSGHNLSESWDFTSTNGYYIASGQQNSSYKMCAEVEHLVSQFNAYYPGKFDSTLESCNIDCSNYERVQLTYRQDFHAPGNLSGCENEELAKVKITNGSSIQNYLTFDTNRTNGEVVTVDVSESAAFESNVKIQFYYFNKFYNNYYCSNFGHWLFDDVYLSGYNISKESDTCIKLDGDNDYIELPNESDYDFTNSMTLECWIKVDNFDTQWQAIVTKGDNSWRLHRYNNTNYINFVAGYSSVTSTSNFNDDQWHHLAVVHDDTELFMYVDGILEASSASAGITLLNDYPVMIGENAQYTGRNFEGCLEELRIWDTARSQQEIMENMQITLNGNEPGLVSYFQFDQYNWGRNEICDIVGFNDGTIIDAKRIKIDLPIGEGNAQYTSITSPGTYDFPSVGIILEVNNLTAPLDLLINKIDVTPEDLPDFDVPFDSQYWILKQFGDAIIDADITFTVAEDVTDNDENNPANLKLFERQYAGMEEWSFNSSSVYASAVDNKIKFENISEFQQFIIGRTNSDNVIISTYPADDELQAYLSDEIQIQFNRIVYPGTANLYIMNSDNSVFETISASAASFNGDTVVLDPLNNLIMGSEYYILMDNDFLSNAYGNCFEISDPTSWNFTTRNVENIPGSCLTLDGVNDYAQINDCVIPASEDFTISFWTKADPDQTGFREIISQNAGTGGEDFYIGRSSDGYIRLGDDWLNSGVLFPSDGEWHYFAFVKTSNEALFYFDCNLSATNPNSIQNPAGSEFRFGRQYGSFEEYFEGQIDEVKIWNIALGADEVIANMNLSLNGSESGLVAYYQFYESTNNRIIDLVSSFNSSFTNTSKIASTIPVGAGTSFSQDILAYVPYFFTGTGVELTPTYLEAPSRVTINKINSAPNAVPDVDEPFTQQYWVNYETLSFDGITKVYPIENLTIEDQNYPTRISLFSRSMNSDEQFQYISSASNVDAAANSATFDVNLANSQLFVGRAIQQTLISELSPQDGEEGVLSDSDLIVTFNRHVFPDNAVIEIYNYDDDTLFESITLTNDNFNENIVTIDANNFTIGSHYYVLIDDDAFVNLYGGYFEGFYDKDDWDFTVKCPDRFAGGCFTGTQYDAGVYVEPDPTLIIPNSLTFETWFYGDGSFYPNSGGVCFFNFDDTSTFGPKFYFQFANMRFDFYHYGCSPEYTLISWPDFQYDRWYHIVVAYDGQNVKIYIDGELLGSNPVTGTLPTPDKGIYMGIDRLYYISALTGSMDEIRLWNIARTEEEIRENMHLTLQGSEPGLVSYWQMNEIVNGTFIDVVNANNANIEWSGLMTDSSVPVAGGTSSSQVVNSAGTIDFPCTDLSMTINSISDENTLVVSKLEDQPNLDPVIDEPFNSQYWIVNSFGDGSIDTDITFTPSETLTLQDEQNPTDIHLYSRTSTSNGDWLYLLNAVAVNATDNEATFAGITDFSQFILGRSIGSIDVPENVSIQIIGNSVQISWEEVTAANSYKIFASNTIDGTYTDVTDSGTFGSIDSTFEYGNKTLGETITKSIAKSGRSLQTWNCDLTGFTQRFFYITASNLQPDYGVIGK